MAPRDREDHRRRTSQNSEYAGEDGEDTTTIIVTENIPAAPIVLRNVLLVNLEVLISPWNTRLLPQHYTPEFIRESMGTVLRGEIAAGTRVMIYSYEHGHPCSFTNKILKMVQTRGRVNFTPENELRFPQHTNGVINTILRRILNFISSQIGRYEYTVIPATNSDFSDSREWIDENIGLEAETAIVDFYGEPGLEGPEIPRHSGRLVQRNTSWAKSTDYFPSKVYSRENLINDEIITLIEIFGPPLERAKRDLISDLRSWGAEIHHSLEMRVNFGPGDVLVLYNGDERGYGHGSWSTNENISKFIAHVEDVCKTSVEHCTIYYNINEFLYTTDSKHYKGAITESSLFGYRFVAEGRVPDNLVKYEPAPPTSNFVCYFPL